MLRPEGSRRDSLGNARGGAPAPATRDPKQESLARELLALPGGLGSADYTLEDDAIANEIFARLGEDLDGRALRAPGQRQPARGHDLVVLVTERLAQAIGPAAGVAVSAVETDLLSVSRADRLESILQQLAGSIEDPEAAYAFRKSVMELALG